MMKRKARARPAAALSAVLMTACGARTTTSGSGVGTLNYWLWDAAQLPAVPGRAPTPSTQPIPRYKIKITQYGWADYWNKLTTAFVVRHRAGRVHQPPVVLPPVRRQEPALAA